MDLIGYRVLSLFFQFAQVLELLRKKKKKKKWYFLEFNIENVFSLSIIVINGMAIFLKYFCYRVNDIYMYIYLNF